MGFPQRVFFTAEIASPRLHLPSDDLSDRSPLRQVLIAAKVHALCVAVNGMIANTERNWRESYNFAACVDI
jgi:hypothetical protein